MYAEKPGGVSWIDLTVDNAEELRDFYAETVGFNVENVDMGGYSDFMMLSKSDKDLAVGVCHARGSNTGLPPQWLVYFNVADLDESLKSCESRGGKRISGPKSMGESIRYCVIEDPAGAVCALIEKREKREKLE